MSVSDVVRRGTSNVLANWPTVAIRAAVTALAAIPATEALPEDWFHFSNLRFPIVIMGTVVVLVALVVHSFITAGNASVYIGGERAVRAARALPSEVSAYRVFDTRQWLAAAKSSVWRVAGIYCAAAGIAILGVGITFAIIDGLHQMSGAFGCGGTGLIVLLVLALGFSFVICLPKAIVICVGRSLSSRESLRLAWGEAMDDIGAHVWPVIAAGFILGIAGTGIAGLRSLLEATSSPWVQTGIMSFVEQGLAAVGTCWLLAMITALTDVTPDEQPEPTPVRIAGE